VTTEAKPHDHRWCPVAAAIARRAAAGREQWGTRHELGAVADVTNEDGSGALDIKKGLYLARSCKRLRKEGLPLISIQADYDRLPDGTFRVWVRVFSRAGAKKEIVRRVNNGEPLAYNAMR
jgi:hypothetical protein